MSDNDWMNLCKVIDMHCNNQISYHEFITAASDHCLLLKEDNLKAAFNLIDSENTGYIDQENMSEKFS
jgi:Ca2+-binding EF-hand superfamily protein